MRIAIIGFGNVGYHLCKKCIELNKDIAFIYNRSPVDIPPFVRERNIPILQKLEDIPQEVDICILSVVDDAISKVADMLPAQIKSKAIIAHTSGIHGLEVFKEVIKHPASFYPLNSFSKEGKVNWQETPVFITAAEEDEHKLMELAKAISEETYTVDKQQKAVLHACAVMVNNFPNALFQMAENILNEHELDLKPLLPLIKTTAEKVQDLSPKEAQTGPALREDRETIERHLELLQTFPFEKQVYVLLSHYINPKLKKNENDWHFCEKGL